MISELTKVPIGWEKIKFGDIAQNVTDRIDNPKESSLKDYIGLEHLDTDEIRIKRYGSPDQVEATKFLCRKGDIIFGKRRAYLRKLAVTSRDAVVSAHSMVLRPNEEKVVSGFLPWFMQSSQFWKTAFAISEGSLSPTIKWKTLSAQEFWIPGWNEQRKIAKILWNIESSVERLEQLIQVTEKLNKGLLGELLTKGVGHEKFKKTALGEMPKNWEYRKLSECVFVVRTMIDPQRYPSEDFEYYTVPGYDQSKKILREKGSSIQSSKFVVNDDVVLFCKLNPRINRVWLLRHKAQVRQICSTEFIPFAVKDGILIKYLFYILKSSFISEISQSFQKGTSNSHKRVAYSDLLRIEIPIPPIPVQNAIIGILDNLSRTLKECESLLRDTKKLEKQLTNSFLSGEILISKENMN